VAVGGWVTGGPGAAAAPVADAEDTTSCCEWQNGMRLPEGLSVRGEGPWALLQSCGWNGPGRALLQAARTARSASAAGG